MGLEHMSTVPVLPRLSVLLCVELILQIRQVGHVTRIFHRQPTNGRYVFVDVTCCSRKCFRDDSVPLLVPRGMSYLSTETAPLCMLVLELHGAEKNLAR